MFMMVLMVMIMTPFRMVFCVEVNDDVYNGVYDDVYDGVSGQIDDEVYGGFHVDVHGGVNGVLFIWVS